MSATLVRIRNPFAPQRDRTLEVLPPGASIRAVLDARGIDEFAAPMVCLLNGDPVLRAQWPVVTLCEGDLLACVALPQGGGGGGSNPLRTVLQLAIIAAASYVPGALGLTGLTASLTSAGIAIGGALLVNALLPPPKPVQQQSASPTYSLSAQGNAARLMQPIPVLYGRHIVYPDYAAAPYAEYAGNEQYLYQLFCISQGSVEVEEIRIKDTPVATFPEISYELVPPGFPVTLFPDDVVTSVEVGGQELKGTNESGAGYVGPFPACLAGQRANWIAVDLALAQGLFHMSKEGEQQSATVSWQIQAREIDDAGAPLGSFVTLSTETLELSTVTPQRLSRRFSVTLGRYEVQIQRTNDREGASDNRTGDLLAWEGMRGYLPSTRLYGDVTLLAMRMRATGTLSAASTSRINVIATRCVPIWDGSTWSAPQPTRSPAWAIADAARNTTYGAGLADSRIDLFGLLTLANTWAARGDTFDGVFDQKISFWEATTRISRVGRALPMLEMGVLRIARDGPQTIRSAMFTPRNIAAGSLSIDYAFRAIDSPDHVIVEYIDGTTWQAAEVACVLPGSAGEIEARVQLFGCTSRDQAWREGISMAAANRDQRRLIHISTEMDGYLPSWGDLVSVSHDVPAWGGSGEVIDITGDRVTTAEPLVWTDGAPHYLALRTRTGAVDGPYHVTRGVDDSEAILPTPLAWSPVIDGSRERPYYQFGPGERWALDCRVIGITPRDATHVDLLLVNSADSVHTAELTGEPPAPPLASLLPGVPTGPVVGSLTVIDDIVPGRALASWTGAAGAIRYDIESSADGATWTSNGSTADTGVPMLFAPGTWYVRVRGVGLEAGAWRTWTGALGVRILPPSTPAPELQSAWVGTFWKVQWPTVSGAVYYVVQVLTGATVIREITVTDLTYTYSIEMAREDGYVLAAYDITVVAGNSGGESDAGTLSITNAAPGAPTLSKVSDGSGGWNVSWPALSEIDIAYYESRIDAGAWSTNNDREVLSVATGQVVDARAVDIWGGVGSVGTITA